MFLWCLTFEFTALEIRLNLVLMSYLQVVQETNAESGVALVLDQTSAELCNKVNKLVFSPKSSFFFLNRFSLHVGIVLKQTFN